MIADKRFNVNDANLQMPRMVFKNIREIRPFAIFALKTTRAES
jgi:hypothetical protein